MANPSLAMIPSGYKATKLYSVLPEDGTGDFTVARASTATRVNSDGLIETVAANVPRLDYTDGGCPVLLTEPQSTNLVTNSEPITYLPIGGSGIVFDSYSWDIGFTNSLYCPDNSIDRYFTMPCGNSTFYYISFFVKMDDGSVPVIGYLNDAFDPLFDLFIDNTQSMTNVKYTNISGNEYRFEGYILSNPSFNQVSIRKRTANSSKGIRVTGLQLEIASPTSYIKTEGTTVTRVADVITVAPPAGVTSIVETIDSVDQTPITVIPTTYTVPNGNINKIIMT